MADLLGRRPIELLSRAHLITATVVIWVVVKLPQELWLHVLQLSYERRAGKCPICDRALNAGVHNALNRGGEVDRQATKW